MSKSFTAVNPDTGEQTVWRCRLKLILRDHSTRRLARRLRALGVQPQLIEYVGPCAVYHQIWVWLGPDQAGRTLRRLRWLAESLDAKVAAIEYGRPGRTKKRKIDHLFNTESSHDQL